jgi:hypothetical protein
MTKLSNTHILVIVSVIFIGLFYFYAVTKSPLSPGLSITSTSTPSTISSSTTSSTTTVTPAPGPDLEQPEEPQPRPEPKPVATKACFIGGCSSQICSAEEGVVSTCEWRSAYACYQKTTCEVQPSGECGWTPNAELNKCLVESENSAF